VMTSLSELKIAALKYCRTRRYETKVHWQGPVQRLVCGLFNERTKNPAREDRENVCGEFDKQSCLRVG